MKISDNFLSSQSKKREFIAILIKPCDGILEIPKIIVFAELVVYMLGHADDSFGRSQSERPMMREYHQGIRFTSLLQRATDVDTILSPEIRAQV